MGRGLDTSLAWLLLEHLLLGGLLLGPCLAARASELRAEVKVAIIGDQGLTQAAAAVLQLIAAEGVDAVLHNGDFDYADDPAAWMARIDTFLGPDLPYFASVGNHDAARYYDPGGYQDLLEARMNRLGIPWQGDLGVQSSFEWEGIFFVLTGPSVFGAGDGFHDLYIREQLSATDSLWRISGWHENMTLMQVEGKGNTTGWGVYEESRRGGALVTTGHAHSYSRTHLLQSVQLQQVADTSNDYVISADDPETPEDEGRSVVVVSGLAGRGIRAQQRGGPWWASIYSSTQDAAHGALFAVFYEDGIPNRARFYFKNVRGEVIDEFRMTSVVNTPLEPTLVSESVEVPEGDAGSRDAEVRVALLAPDGTDVSVDYATSDRGATVGTDYEGSAGRLVFAPGEAEQTIRVPVHGDAIEEGDESFSVDYSNPVGATLRVSGSTVTIVDDDSPSAVTLSVSSHGGGTVAVDPPGGTYPPGTPVTLTALPAPGYVFDGWSGDLAGRASPESLVLDSDRAVAASFALAATVLHEMQAGGTSDTSSVRTDQALTAADGNLYLAAIASKPHAWVTDVSGLGLSWRPLQQQCAGRGQTGVALWQASGTPLDDDTVTATFASAPRNAVISVSRYESRGELQLNHVAGANSTGQPGACSGGSDGTSYGFDLDVTAAGSTVYLAVAMRFRDHLPGPGFVERAELYQGDLAGQQVGLSVAEASATGPPSTAVTGAFDGVVDWAAVAVELNAPRSFDLTLESTNGSLTADPPGSSYPEGSSVALTATGDPGFVFGGWGGDVPAGQGNPAILVMDDHKRAIASFGPGFAVTVVPWLGGSVSLSPPPQGLYPAGTLVTLSATPHPGFVFGGWERDVSGRTGSVVSLVVDADKQVQARFLRAFDVQVAPASGGSIAVDPPQGPYLSASSVTLRATPAPGFAFTGWTGDVPAGRGNPTSLFLDGDKLVGASFAPAFEVQVVPPSGGNVTLDPPGGTYLPGTPLTLTATPASGFVFGGWLGDVPAGAGSVASLVVDADKQVEARFLRVFDVAVTPSSGGVVTLEPAAGPYLSGSTVVVTATAAAGFLFGGWTGDVPAGQGNPASLLVDAAKLVGARFVALEPSLEEIATGGSSESAAVATATPLAVAEGALYLAAISTKPHTQVTGVSGLGLVWSRVGAQCGARSQTGVSLWQARGQGAGGGTVSATLSSVPRNAVIAVTRHSGFPALATAVSANTLGPSGPCSGGQDGTQYAVDLDTTTPNSLAYVAVALRNRNHVPGPGFVEHAEVYQGTTPADAAGLAIAERLVPEPSRVGVTGTMNSIVDWAVVTSVIRGGALQE